MMIVGIAFVLTAAWIVRSRHRLGSTTAAAWLTALGALVIAVEHPQFAMNPGAGGRLVADDHLRLHFFMAGVYALLGLAAIIVVAFTLLRDGRKSGWFTLLAVLVLGGCAELVAAGTWFVHGSPFYEALGEGETDGMGWQLIHGYLLAWIAALIVSWSAVFRPTIAT